MKTYLFQMAYIWIRKIFKPYLWTIQWIASLNYFTPVEYIKWSTDGQGRSHFQCIYWQITKVFEIPCKLSILCSICFIHWGIHRRPNKTVGILQTTFPFDKNSTLVLIMACRETRQHDAKSTNAVYTINLRGIDVTTMNNPFSSKLLF